MMTNLKDISTKELRKEIMSNQAMRIKYCEKDFFPFLLYYFGKHLRYPEMSDFHKKRAKAINEGKNINADGMREIGKSLILGAAREIRLIVYRKRWFIVNLCYDKRKAKSFNRLVVNELLTNTLIKRDFGVLYQPSGKTIDKLEQGLQESGVGEFKTTNGIKVKAFGMGETLRGEIHNSPIGIVRPDHLMADDLDNNRNTRNARIIEEDMAFIQEEVLGGMSTEGHSIVWLGNVIRKDGRNPRMRGLIQGKKNWVVFRNFLFGDAGKTSGTPSWSRFTLEPGPKGTKTIQDLKDDQMSGFPQNSLGIPRIPGEQIFKSSWVSYFDFDIKYEKITIGVDPAFSTKTNTDAMGIVVVGQSGDQYFVLEALDLEGEEKSDENVEIVMKTIYNKYHARSKIIIVESNNGGELYGRNFKKWGMSTKTIAASKDKITRFKEKEGILRSGKVSYKTGMTEGLVTQLLEFTGEAGGDDDMVDAFVYALYSKGSSGRKRIGITRI